MIRHSDRCLFFFFFVIVVVSVFLVAVNIDYFCLKENLHSSKQCYHWACIHHVLRYFDHVTKIILIITILLGLCKYCVAISASGVASNSSFGNAGQMFLLSSTYRLTFWHMHWAVWAETCTCSLVDWYEQWLEGDDGLPWWGKGRLDGPADWIGITSIFMAFFLRIYW